jgi:hypothetical protein
MRRLRPGFAPHRLRSPRAPLGGLVLAAALAATSAAPPADAQSIGLSAVRAQRFFNEDLLFFEPETGDRFATALVAGDFDGDGADDLATGMPFDDGFANGGGPVDSGSVIVRYGLPGRGLAGGLADTILNQLAGGSSDPAEENDRFGFSLAACDFDGDGFADLVVGVPNEESPTSIPETNAGAVHVHRGRASGLSANDDAFFSQGTPGVPGDPEIGDQFGRSLACGDFDGDGFADLAVGVPCNDITVQSGAINVFPGSPAGLDPASATVLEQNSPGMEDGGDPSDAFGFALAAGDFDGDGFADLAIGVPGETFAGQPARHGAVHVVLGGAAGLTGARDFLFGESFVGGSAEAEDRFGSVLAAGDFDGDGFDDLAVGVPNEDLGGVEDCGNVVEIFGSATGIVANGAQAFDQDRILGGGSSESEDHFGASLATGDFDRDGFDDLAVGHPGEFVTGPTDGAATVVMGSQGFGLDPLPNRHRSIAAGHGGFPGNPDAHRKDFAAALVSGDFDGDGYADLGVGAPFEDVDGVADVGTATILYGALFADGFDSGPAEILWSFRAP